MSALWRVAAADKVEMTVVSRQDYHRAKARHKSLYKWLYVFVFAGIFYGLLFGWARTGSLALYHQFIGIGDFVEALLSPLIPAIDNVVHDYHADGYGARASFARHVAAMGWLFGLVGSVAFYPMIWMDKKFLKRGEAVLRLKRKSSILAILWSIAAFAAASFGACFFFFGGGYNDVGDGGLSWMVAIRVYDLSAGGAMVFPFVLLFAVPMAIIHMLYCFKTAHLVWRLKRRGRAL